MIILVTLSFFFILLLKDVTLINSEGDNAEMKMKIVKPGTLVKYVVPMFPEIEKFGRVEARLENLTDMAKLYQAPESDRDDILKKLRQNTEVQKLMEECKKFHVRVVCSDRTYRSVDGSCNNLKHPEWGKAITENGRLLPANYEGTNGLRKSESGEDLPLVRTISLSMTNFSNPTSLVTALFTFLGQFLAHDLTLTPVMSENGDKIDCCDPSKKKNDPFCIPAYIPPDDPFYGKYNVSCLRVTRALPYPKCNLGKRGALNKQSSFVDLSQVYGYNNELSTKLRANDGTGRLRTQDTKYGQLMPKNHDKNANFCPQAKIERCFEGGDDRTNQHTMLITLETTFVRLHNNIADSLHKMSPNWDDEGLLQESRRLAIAMYQNIIYDEYLPLLLGSKSMEKYDLYPDFERGSLYNEEVNPSVFAEFAAAAFRAHSMVPTFVSGAKPQLKFRHTYSNFKPIHRGHSGLLLTGASEVRSENNDEFQTHDMSEYLYRAPGETYGADMTTVDIQRGRDVGLPTYSEMLQFCFGYDFSQDFSQLSASGLMTEKKAEDLRNIYNYVGDIDLLIGILREMRGNAVFGPTARCIASIQFHRLKFGDSFHFTHINGRNPFNKEQLEFLSTYSLARIICETTKLEKVRRSPLMMPSANNPLVMCSTFPPMNLMPWKDQSS